MVGMKLGLYCLVTSSACSCSLVPVSLDRQWTTSVSRPASLAHCGWDVQDIIGTHQSVGQTPYLIDAGVVRSQHLADHELHLGRLVSGAVDDATLEAITLAFGRSVLAVEDGSIPLRLGFAEGHQQNVNVVLELLVNGSQLMHEVPAVRTQGLVEQRYVKLEESKIT